MHSRIQTCSNILAHAQRIEIITKTCRGSEILCSWRLTLYSFTAREHDGLKPVYCSSTMNNCLDIHQRKTEPLRVSNHISGDGRWRKHQWFISCNTQQTATTVLWSQGQKLSWQFYCKGWCNHPDEMTVMWFVFRGAFHGSVRQFQAWGRMRGVWMTTINKSEQHQAAGDLRLD